MVQKLRFPQNPHAVTPVSIGDIVQSADTARIADA
jgi:hypothetical protein